MKKFLSAFVCLVLCFLCACTPQTTTEDTSKITLSPYSMPQATGETVALYYPTKDFLGVLASTEEIERKSQSFYFDVVSALLDGTKTFESAFLAGISCRSTMLVQNVLYLDFSHQFEKMEPLRLFACCAVLAKTFTSMEEIDFINITVEGKQLTYPNSTRRIMLLSRYSSDASSLLSIYNSLSSAKDKQTIDTFYTVLYSSSGNSLIPQVKSISVADNNYARAIVSQALTVDQTLFASGFSVKNVSYKNSHVSIELTAPSGWKTPSGWLASRALAAALDCIYSDLKQVSLTVYGSAGELLYSLSHETGEIFNYIKSRVNVFVPSKNDVTFTTMLVSKVPSRNDLTDFMADYIASLAPALRDNDNVIRQIVFSDEMLILDLDEAFYLYFASQENQSEYATVYSIIATACAFSGANRVMFLQNGQVRSHFSSKISLKTPLYNLPKDFLDSLK